MSTDPLSGPGRGADDAEHDLGFATLDIGRGARRGYPEAVYCAGKTAAQVAGIAESYRDRGIRALFTRVLEDQVDPIQAVLPDATHDVEARMILWPPRPPEATGGTVTVVTAGTSDLSVAREAYLTAQHLGRRTTLIADVGVAGLHRLLRRLDDLRAADCLVVVAGMDGALPSVVAGLVPAPVVAVPTSVGYGAAFGGVAALLSMLNSCSPGIAVVNIDNGFGAGCFAAQVTAPRRSDY